MANEEVEELVEERVEGPRHLNDGLPEGERVGCAFVVKTSDEVAKLRLLLVEPKARGLGLGSRLVEECIRFARSRGYETLTPRTNSVLDAARHIYEEQGFMLVEEEEHHGFGKDLVGQNWRLAL